MVKDKADAQGTLQRLPLRLETLACLAHKQALRAQLQGLLEQQQELRNNHQTTNTHLEYVLQGLYSKVESMGHLPQKLSVLYEHMKRIMRPKGEKFLRTPI